MVLSHIRAGNLRPEGRSSPSIREWYWRAAWLVMVVSLVGCGEDALPEAEAPRPVRTITVTKQEGGARLSFTGQIEAQDSARLGFRIGGRLQDRLVNIGDQVEAGRILARLESQNERNVLRTAEAGLTAAQAAANQAENQMNRQRTLLRHWTTRVLFEQAEMAHLTARANVDAAAAQLKAARDLVGFTEITADAPGIVVAIGAEPGEVVQAGQTAVTLARGGGRDAIFHVPAAVLRGVPTDATVEVRLADAPSIVAKGRAREVAPQADPVTRTFEVKIGLIDPPESMRLGATVIGTAANQIGALMRLPASAITRTAAEPAVWVVDPASQRVDLRPVEILSFDPAFIEVGGGLQTGEIVVTAGVHALHPGRAVRLVGSAP
jgi:RND family efflux transporter MFP subunit